MMYRIARNEQVFGPYTEEEVRRYFASGNIGPSDLAQAEGAGDWVPVAELFPFVVAAMPAPAMVATPTLQPQGFRLYPDPPDFPWWAALILGIITGGLFFVVWDIVEASWLRRIERKSTALMLYIGVAALYLFKVPAIWETINYNAFGGPNVQTSFPGVGLAGLILTTAARFVFRRELLEHFNLAEQIPLRLNGFWTLLFGGLYFQYHFNQINRVKRATRTSVPSL